ncbi:MAG TPA: DUF2254 domain-containing protein [Acidimicrobiales bacterium]|nr:DUF2254 domain-containing protein [Acidimicrobiales bacterium]
MSRRWRAPAARSHALRTNLWLIPTIEVAGAVLLFVAIQLVDKAAYRGDITLPSWIDNGSADAARQILTAIAAAVITVVGLVFSITIVALTLASTQFGPRILGNFIRDRGTQVTLGTFVATFVFAVLALGSISTGSHGEYVPHASITVALALVLLSLGVLIYFIHHVATSIQLPQVIASIARDLAAAIEAEDIGAGEHRGPEAGLPVAELRRRIDDGGAAVPAPASGYLQLVAFDTLVTIAAEAQAVIRLTHRPGHFVVAGGPLAHVWPAEAVPQVTRSLERAHLTGPHRTLAQDLTFAIDQLVEIAIRALSPAVNDTFSALTCIDWLSDGLCKITARWRPAAVHRDRQGYVRVIAARLRYERVVDRAFDTIRQASAGMPAVMIRQLDALAAIMGHTTTADQRAALLDQAAMIQRGCDESVPEPGDRADVRRRYDAVLAAARQAEERAAPES